MKCSKCKREVAEDSLFCEYCGNQVRPLPPQRHDFVTFILWLMGLGGVMAIMIAALQFYTGFIDMIAFTFLCTGLICLYSAYLLLAWKKIGYWLTMGAAGFDFVVMAIFNNRYPFYGGMITVTILSFTIPLVLFFVLQVKKNGRSCWSLLK